jgi:hypothetical protein
VTILELLVAVTLVSFIVLALYQMFDRTQVQMRRAVRETDKYESGRSTMDIIRRDLSQLGAVKTLQESGVGAIGTNWVGVTAPNAYNPATYYPPGSLVSSGGNSYFALTASQNTALTSTLAWAPAAPNFRVSSAWAMPTPMAMTNAAGLILQTNDIHDVFFLYFDPDVRTTAVTAGSIQPGVSYMTTSASTTYNGFTYPNIGAPFYGVATAMGAPVPSLTVGTAVRVEGGWRAIGYRLASSTNALYPLSTTPGMGTLYRYELGTYGNHASRISVALSDFASTNYFAQTNVFRRIADNVVHFRCQAVSSGALYPPVGGNVQFFGTALPSHVEFELGILDSKTAAQVQGMAANLSVASAYLGRQGDAVQLFRLQIPIRPGQ